MAFCCGFELVIQTRTNKKLNPSALAFWGDMVVFRGIVVGLSVRIISGTYKSDCRVFIQVEAFFDILFALQEFIYKCRVIFRNSCLWGILEQTFLIELRFLYSDSLANTGIEELCAELVGELV